MLYGRNDEQARISALLARARGEGRSGALLLRGEAGIGKSVLLDHAADLMAGDDGARVLRVTGIEAESGITFAGINQLLWPVRDRLDGLPGPQAEALRAALSGLGPSGEVPPARDRFTTGLAVLTLLADLAEDGPVLCLIDDAQWLDGATAEALLFAARRLAAEGVVMLFAARDDAFTGVGLPELPLERLGRDDAERLLIEHGLAPAVRDRVLHESRGNPLALREFGMAGARLPDGSRPLPVTDRVVARFQSQIDELPDKTRLMLLIAAAEGRGYMPSLLGAAREMGVGLGDLEQAERAGLVEVSGRSIAFRHPLVRAAVYQGAVANCRIAVHRALASSSEDADCRARHRASAALGPDEDIAVDLQDAAERARRRTGYATAARLYEQAAYLSPDMDARAARFRAAASMALQGGRPDEAEDFAAKAGTLTDDPTELARLGRVRAVVEYERGNRRAAARMMVEHAARAMPDDKAAMLRAGATYAWTSGETPALLRAAESLPDDAMVGGLAHLAGDDLACGVPLLTGLVAHARTTTPEPGTAAGLDEAAQLALILGDDEAALELAAAEAARCRLNGLIGALPGVLRTQAQAQVATGLHTDAEATLIEAISLACDTGLPNSDWRLSAVFARVAAVEGDESRLCAMPENTGGALGLLELGLGRYDDALRHLEAVPYQYSADTMLAMADLVEAAMRAGQPERARAPLDRFRAWADAVQQPWALATALRCEALLADSEEPYEQAIRLHEKATRPFEKPVPSFSTESGYAGPVVAPTPVRLFAPRWKSSSGYAPSPGSTAHTLNCAPPVSPALHRLPPRRYCSTASPHRNSRSSVSPRRASAAAR
ncbi:ATP-binding protein [Actinomadura opuntiae]|uniref:ATP-binding protein n=1 Tax=Actinomadura sp. OS1-43 TaxID=604315 RepID=UPI00255A967F|nr:AAA family ATPase [Actinomadura sp. OS1-43]MDL4814996.1 AAA family ATPase [Actinomadura sp. OS1-43]